MIAQGLPGSCLLSRIIAARAAALAAAAAFACSSRSAQIFVQPALSAVSMLTTSRGPLLYFLSAHPPACAAVLAAAAAFA